MVEDLFSEKEIAVIKSLAQEQGVSTFAIQRQALRLYQIHHERLKAGETCTYSGDEQRAKEFSGNFNMRRHFYVDCEFDGHGGPLLSIAIIREDDAGLYLIVENTAKDPWVIENVLPKLMDYPTGAMISFCPENKVSEWLLSFLQEDADPIFHVDAIPDVTYLTKALSTSYQGEYCPNRFDNIAFLVSDVESYPTDIEGAVQHNAYYDAMTLKRKLTAK